MSVHERLYLHGKLQALEASAVHLEERAARTAPAEADALRRRAAKNRSRAERLREYVASTGWGGVPVDDAREASADQRRPAPA